MPKITVTVSVRIGRIQRVKEIEGDCVPDPKEVSAEAEIAYAVVLDQLRARALAKAGLPAQETK